MFVSENDILSSEPRTEMSSVKTRSPSVPHPQFMNSCIWSGQREKEGEREEEKKKSQRGTSSTGDENPSVIQQGGSGQEKVFKIKLS